MPLGHPARRAVPARSRCRDRRARTGRNIRQTLSYVNTGGLYHRTVTHHRTVTRRHGWSDRVPVDAADARARLLDAAEACLLRHGLAKTTVGDVAVEAEVSRATVYRYFAGRHDLVLGVILRKADTYLRWLEDRRLPRGRFADALVEGVLLTVDAAQADELLGLLFASESARTAGSIAGASDALAALALQFLRPLLVRAQERGDLRADVAVDDAAEWVLRTILSLLTVPGVRRRDRAERRAFVASFLVPALCPPAG